MADYQSIATKETTATHWLLLFLIWLMSCPAMGQDKQKKRLTRDRYEEWHQLFPDKISEHGNWLSYTHHYKSGTDTLFVANSHTKKIFALPNGSSSALIKETHFVCLQPGGALRIIDLEAGTFKVLQDVVEFAVAGNLIITRSVGGLMKIIDRQGATIRSFDGVVQMKVSPTGKSVAYVGEKSGEYSVSVIDIATGSKTILAVAAAMMGNLVWQEEGRGLAFLRPQDNKDRGAAYYYHFAERKIRKFSPSGNDHLSKELGVGAYVQISDDGQRIFFMLESSTESIVENSNLVQVWNTADKDLYPAKITKKGWKDYSKVAVWRPFTGDCRQLTDNSMPNLILSGDQRHAITSNALAYEPQFKAFSDRDYAITDLDTGEQHIFLEAFSGNVNNLLVSPGGKFVTYFDHGDWWNYDIEKKKHFKLEIPGLAKDDVAGFPNEGTSYGSPGWTLGDKEVLLYDAYDIWKVAPDGRNAKRLTRGRETRTVFRISPKSPVKPFQYSFDGCGGAQYDLSKPLYLTAYMEAEGKTGMFIMEKKQRERPLVYMDRLIDNFLISADGKRFAYVEQDFDLPPQLVLDSFLNPHAVVAARSNRQHDAFFWGRTELVKYNVLGKEMAGVLVYPASYDIGRKYPMIVHIYENQSKELHQYVLPHLPESRGFNITNYSLQDYFVFLPAISPVVGDTGNAALACVNAAMEKIKGMGIIDEGRMALIGHSFGGFEANFIATKEHPFRTIVSGCGYSDLIADYLYIARDFQRQEYWRYEAGQMRMGKSLYEDPERYFRNSPILLAEGVGVPILAWTGEKDRNVDAAHSFKFHMALRRLKKESVLLVYPEEKHVLSDSARQQDLRQKMEEWFAYYLKDGPMMPWMQADYIGG